jgi:hypothetical protein
MKLKFQILITAWVLASGYGPSVAAVLTEDFSGFSPTNPSFTVQGNWAATPGTVTNTANGDNRLFLNDLETLAAEYELSTTATLTSGKGWELFFDAGFDALGQVSGVSVVYDDKKNEDRVSLVSWSADVASNLATISLPAQIPAGQAQTILVYRDADGVRVDLDGTTVLSWTLADTPGGVPGLRVLGNSDATFGTVNLDTNPGAAVPEPTMAVLLLAGLGALAIQQSKVHSTKTGLAKILFD